MSSDLRLPPIIVTMIESMLDDRNPKAAKFNNYNTLSDVYNHIGKALATYEKANGMKIVKSGEKR